MPMLWNQYQAMEQQNAKRRKKNFIITTLVIYLNVLRAIFRLDTKRKIEQWNEITLAGFNGRVKRCKRETNIEDFYHFA